NTGGSYDLQVDVDPHQHHLHVSQVQSLLPNPGQNANVLMNGVTPVVEPAQHGETIDLQQYRSGLLASAPSDAPTLTIDISHGEP
ncbi:hypothetical protein GYK49_14445, partial [Lactobacillus paracasei]|uniref:hypothetical protein n=1 Tax=Lacticaseibacillus paracasei TaxID=1597 RepID=UPI0013A6B669